MPGYYGVKLGRHWNGLKIEIWDLQDLHSNTVYLVSKGEIIFTLKIIKTHRDRVLKAKYAKEDWCNEQCTLDIYLMTFLVPT